MKRKTFPQAPSKKKISHLWTALPGYLKVGGTILGLSIAAIPVIYNIWIVPVRTIYIKAENLMDLIRANDDLIYWVCTAHATTTEEYKIKTAFYPLLKEYQDDRKKRLLELVPFTVEMDRIGTYASLKAADEFRNFQNWHWDQYKFIASTNSCPPASSLKNEKELLKWEKDIFKSMPYSVLDFVWFYFEGFWKKDQEKQENSPQEKLS